MKKDSITIPYDEEKWRPCGCTGAEGQSVEQEMSLPWTLSTPRLPGNVREFLDLLSGMEVKPTERVSGPAYTRIRTSC